MISAEKKVELIAKIREENNDNAKTMRGREELLYGIKRQPFTSYDEINSSEEVASIPKISSFKVRFLLMSFCVLSIILLDKFEVEFVQRYFNIYLEQIDTTFKFFTNIGIHSLF